MRVTSMDWWKRKEDWSSQIVIQCLILLLSMPISNHLLVQLVIKTYNVAMLGISQVYSMDSQLRVIYSLMRMRMVYSMSCYFYRNCLMIWVDIYSISEMKFKEASDVINNLENSMFCLSAVLIRKIIKRSKWSIMIIG